MQKVELPYARSYNFSAGPATLPIPVLEKARDEMMNYRGSGQSVMEMSHRSKVYVEIFENARKSLRTLMNIPDNYDILFLQGGATMMFAGIPLNLLNVPGATEKPTVDYIVTGDWSKKGADEAKMYKDFCNVNVACDAKTAEGYVSIPDQSTWKLTPGAAYVHYCTNETIRGVCFNELPTFPEGTTVVCDMSSDFLSRPIDVSKFGVIYAGAQKNSGPAGATIIIIRRDLIGRHIPICPSAINFKKQADKDSMLNTPPCYSVYICGLLFEYLHSLGGLEAVYKTNLEKAKLVYEAMDESKGFYDPFVKDPKFRSLMNVPFRIRNKEEQNKDNMTPTELEYVSSAQKVGLVNLKGYRDLGGIRVSMYNALTLDGIKVLKEFMTKFYAEHPIKE